MDTTSFEWPSDLNDLAAIHFDPQESEQRRADAFERMSREIENIARIILRTKVFLGKQAADDAIAKAPDVMWSKHDKFIPGDRYKSWCWTILTNHFIDIRRKQKRGPFVTQFGQYSRDDDSPIEDSFDDNHLRPASLIASFLKTLFPLTDLEILQAWDPKIRCVLLLKSGMWRKVPLEIEREWFAGMDLVNLADTKNTTFAEAMGISESGFATTWWRHKGALTQLSSVQDLAESLYEDDDAFA